jgi:hypothetical protein
MPYDMRIFLPVFLVSALITQAQELYEIPGKSQTRWISFENPSGEPGLGGKENKGAKSHAFDVIDLKGKNAAG